MLFCIFIGLFDVLSFEILRWGIGVVFYRFLLERSKIFFLRVIWVSFLWVYFFVVFVGVIFGCGSVLLCFVWIVEGVMIFCFFVVFRWVERVSWFIFFMFNYLMRGRLVFIKVVVFRMELLLVVVLSCWVVVEMGFSYYMWDYLCWFFEFVFVCGVF